jgi:hypothetical protein
MDSVHEHVLEIEMELADGPGEPYRRHLIDEAVVVVPGAVLDRESCAAAMDESPGWDERDIGDVRFTKLTADSLTLTYRWRSRRAEQGYRAIMSSVYVRRDDTWKLALHQQTPEPSHAEA